jgi:general secretion pathway protein A
MYLDHFNLEIKPFRISPDPKFLWLGETHKEALAMLQYGIQDNRGFLLLSGDIGTGKTTLINSLLESLDDQILIAMISDPDLEKLDFYNFLAHEFDINKTFKTKGDFLVHFIHFLHKASEEGKKVLIIIDEAQRLRYELLEEIRQLSNIEKKDTKLLNIFLVGQHELIDALNQTRNRALLQRITMKYLIGPLKNEDVGEYIAFRLKIAGAETKIFSSSAVRQVIAFSNGYPRLINIICDHALLTAYVKGKQRVDGSMVKECAKDLHIKVELPKGSQSGISFFDHVVDALRHPRQYPLPGLLIYVGLGAFFAVAILLTLFFTGFAPDWMPKRHASQAVRPPISKMESTGQTTKPDHQAPLPITNSTAVSKQSPQPSPIVTRNKAAEPSQNIAQTPFPFEEKKYIIQFPPDSNEFSIEGYALLDRIIKTALKHTQLEIHVNGYTDSSGDLAYNRQLSRFRANVVKSYLVGNGITTNNLVVAGLGPVNPIASNETPEGRQLNRRVEILLRRIGRED